MRYMIGLALLSLALTGCGTTGKSILKDAPDASYILVTEGEFQGQFTNTEVKGCKVTVGGEYADAEFPFDEFSYEAGACVLKKSGKAADD